MTELNKKTAYIIQGGKVYKFTGDNELKPVLNIKKFITGMALIAVSVIGFFKLATAWLAWQDAYEKEAFINWQTISAELEKR